MGPRPSQLVAALLLLTLVVACDDGGAGTVTSTTGTTVAVSTTVTFDMDDFTMEQVENGQPLEWSPAVVEPDLVPAGLVALGDARFLFATRPDGTGLRAWSSADGLAWAEINTGVPATSPVAVVGTSEDGLVVVTEGTTKAKPEVWTSADGVDWASEEIPIEYDNGLMAFTPTAVEGHGGTLLIAGETRLDATGVVEAAVREALWPAYEAKRFGVDVRLSPSEIQIDVLGPGGLALLTTTAAELGLDDRTQEWMREEPPSEAAVWIRQESAGWSQAEVPGASSITSMSATQLGDIIGSGVTELGLASLWRSFDGFFWEQVPYDVRPDSLAGWVGRLVGPSAVGTLEMVVSDDGVDWGPTGLGAHFPPSMDWFVHSYGVSDRALVVAVESYDVRGTSPDAVGPDPHIRQGEVDIYVDPFYGQVYLFDGTQDYTWAQGPHDETMVFDPVTETISFSRPDGSPLATVGLDELGDLADSARAGFARFGHYFRALAATNDGAAWTIWDTTPLGNDTDPIDVTMAPAAIALATTDHPTGLGLTLWTAPLP